MNTVFPIIESLLEVDLYKLTMMYLAWLKHRTVRVRFGFHNRATNVPLGKILSVGQLRETFDEIRQLRVTSEEIAYLRKLGWFCEEFLQYLSTFSLPEIHVGLMTDGEQLDIHSEGNWPEVSQWETIIMQTVATYYGEHLRNEAGLSRENVYREGRRRLDDKIKTLSRYPELTFADFGNRRRYDRFWHYEVLERLMASIPSQLTGTSNVHYARLLGITPIGTFAHEMDMVYEAIFRSLNTEHIASHDMLMRDWWDLYGESLSIALTDTYGSEYFFQHFTREQALNWKGVRQDSGNPKRFAEELLIPFYQSHGIDPRSKTCVFSDGLTLPVMLDLFTTFYGRLGVAFGWGTNLTNDLGLPTISIVAKAFEACGLSTVKLSDNAAKAMGPAADVSRIRALSGHYGSDRVACVY